MPTLTESIRLYSRFQATGNFSHNTITNYCISLRILSRFLQDPELTSITPEQLQNFMIRLHAEGKKEATRLYYWRALQSFYTWASRWYDTGRPDQTLSRPKAAPAEIIPYTLLDVQKMIAAAGKTRNPKRNLLMIYILLDTGLRATELCGVQYRDVDIDDGSIHIHARDSGIKSRPRKVYLGARTVNLLYPFILAGHPPDRHLIVTAAGTGINRYTARSMIRSIAIRAGVKNGGLHRFRHTFAIQYLRNGGDVYTLRDLLGHTRLDTSIRYLGLAQLDVKAAHQKASPVDCWRI